MLQNELEQLNKALGKTTLSGEGIIIQLIDKKGEPLGDDAYVDAISAENLLIIVNQLFAAGAEAISINGNRIITPTSIVDIGNTEFIKINGKRIADDTYIINAIGNPDYLRSAVLGKGGHVDELKELGHETSVKSSKNVTVEKYDGEIKTKYIN